MSKELVSNFRQTLLKANGNEVKMKKAFRSITGYLDSSVSEKQDGQSVKDFLEANPGIKEIHEWSETVLVTNDYELVNY